jgi:GrpB-like predicted nucleotidyltransferase (UPF0157 family)
MLVPYDPRWPNQFEAVAGELRRLGNPDWQVEHIGSTSIPGLSAKPIIDLAVRIRDHADFDTHRPRLEASGWRVGSGIRSHLVMLLERDGQRTSIAHFFTEENWEENNQRILRDWLLAHPADAAHYESAKVAAVNAAHESGASYNSEKTAAIQQIVDRARVERGLPVLPVYDK